jgi:hypothetical protein
MINSQNSGKYLSGEWNRNRHRAMDNQDTFTADQLSFLESSTFEGLDGYLDRFDSTMDVGTRPVDPLSRSRQYDWRNNPEVGR